jgi:accessory gene regulator protein AgrB
MISVTNFNQILLLLFVICGVIFVMYALATGKMDVEGQDDPVERRRQPAAYWFMIVLFVFLIASSVDSLFNPGSN